MAQQAGAEGLFLEYLDRHKRKTKPRDVGLTMAIAGNGASERFLEGWGECLDIVKFVDHAMYADRSFIEEEIATYRAHDIDVQTGGVFYELATLQGKEEQFLEDMRDIGINWIEYETHVMDPPVEEMEDKIADLKGRGFNVVGEVGSKWYWHDETRLAKDRIDVDRTIEVMERYMEAGCDKLYWEGLIILNLLGRDLENHEGQKALLEVADAIGPENIMFEIWGPTVTPLELPKFWSWLVKQFGPDVNVGNVLSTSAPTLEAIRRGVGYDMDHPYLRWLDADRPTENWWDIEAPPYDVGLEP